MVAMVMSKLIFTCDVPGEREWINRQYADHMNLETYKWNPADIDEILAEPDACNYIREIDPTMNINKSDLYRLTSSQPTYKCLWTEPSFKDTNWCYANKLISPFDLPQINDKNTDTHYQCVTSARAGTVFIESLIRNKITRIFKDHVYINATTYPHDLIDKVTEMGSASIILSYRADLWGWVTSKHIANTYGYNHYNDDIDWTSVAAVPLSYADLTQCRDELLCHWDLFCNVRRMLPASNFYILEFSDMIKKYSDVNSHKRIPYDKKVLISNYDEAEQWFRSDFDDEMTFLSNNGVSNLIAMGCKTDIESEWLD